VVRSSTNSSQRTQADTVVADLCGGIFVDEGFQKYIEALVGTKHWKNLLPEERKATMMKWERNLKQQFNGEDQKTVVGFPIQLTKHIKAGNMKEKLSFRGFKERKIQRTLGYLTFTAYVPQASSPRYAYTESSKETR
jgi:hypothetical protein